MRQFETGATRDSDDGKNDYEGFLSPLVLEAYGDYMTKHRIQADGEVRESDNWQNGMGLSVYIKSLLRHVLDLWLIHRGWPAREGIEDAICGVIFNIMGYFHEYLIKTKDLRVKGVSNERPREGDLRQVRPVERFGGKDGNAPVRDRLAETGKFCTVELWGVDHGDCGHGCGDGDGPVREVRSRVGNADPSPGFPNS